MSAGLIDLNADVGEGGAQDAALFAAGITSANIACGAHAGDASTLATACTLSVAHGVALGAHPGYADRSNFGRREIALGTVELGRLVEAQLLVLTRAAEAARGKIRHVKPHGALYHFLNREPDAARVFAGVVHAFAPGAAVFGPPTGALREMTEVAGLRFVAEGFIDRAYRADGSLVSRAEPGAVLHDEAAVVAQALSLARSGRVETLCVHGDGPEATRLLGVARAALMAAGFRICPPGA